MNKQQVLSYLQQLQQTICSALEQLDGDGRFIKDSWQREEGGGGC